MSKDEKKRVLHLLNCLKEDVDSWEDWELNASDNWEAMSENIDEIKEIIEKE